MTEHDERRDSIAEELLRLRSRKGELEPNHLAETPELVKLTGEALMEDALVVVEDWLHQASSVKLDVTGNLGAIAAATIAAPGVSVLERLDEVAGLVGVDQRHVRTYSNKGMSALASWLLFVADLRGTLGRTKYTLMFFYSDAEARQLEFVIQGVGDAPLDEPDVRMSHGYGSDERYVDLTLAQQHRSEAGSYMFAWKGLVDLPISFPEFVDDLVAPSLKFGFSVTGMPLIEAIDLSRHPGRTLRFKFMRSELWVVLTRTP